MGKRAESVSVVTGFPGPVARHVIVLGATAGEVVVLAQPSLVEAAGVLAGAVGAGSRVLAGDAAAVDLGLSGPDAARLEDSMGVLFHLEEQSGDQRRDLRAAREVVEFAGRAAGASLVAILQGARRRRSRESVPLERVLAGRGAGLAAALVRTGVCTGREGPWPARGHGRLLHLAVLLHLSVDIRRLRSVASRRLVLTSAELAARVCMHAAAVPSSRPGVEETDLRDPRPPTLAEVDRALAGMLESIEEVDGELLSTCRRHRDVIIGRWIGERDPVDVLASSTEAEAAAGQGERVARELGLEWQSTLEVLETCLPAVVRDIRSDLLEETEERDALLG